MRKQLFLSGFIVACSLPTLTLAAQVQVSLGVNSISPSMVSINTGDTVVWSNTSGTAQSVIANNGAFQSGSIGSGGEFAATFNTSGTYNYYDNAGGTAVLGEVIVNGNSIYSSPTTQPQSSFVNPNANYYASASVSTNPNLASLETQLQALITQINTLEGVSGGASTGISGAPSYTSGGACPQIGRVLSIGSSGNDVTSLQQFLTTSVGYTGGATGYFGSLTQAAVGKYQTANNIISYGTPSTTGYGVVGPRTAAAMRLACSGGSTGSGSAGSGIVSGYLQVSPVSGTAPLVTTVTATVNSAASCSGATYTLDFGDGTQQQIIPIASGNCSQQNQSFQHTYQYGGSYTVTLSAGGHSSTATVTVSGQGAPSTAVTAPGNPTQASGSMTAFITSGPAPLSTTFYVSCASGLAYDVVFGDGSDLGSSGVSQSSCNGGLQSVAHTYTAIGSYNAQLVVFVRNAQGAVSSQGVAEQGITVTGPSSSSGSVSSFPPPSLTPNAGGNPLEVSLQFTALSCGQPYSISWGDQVGGTVASGPNIDCVSGSSGQTQSYSITHTYGQAGSYTVTLSRTTSSGNSQNNTVGVSITQ